MKLLILSNGHGEDIIAVRIIEQLQADPQPSEVVALPLVGEGYAYLKQNIPIIGSVQQMPSGGFIYMDGRQFWGDIRGGLLKLTKAQYQVVHQWAKEGGKVLAVGDIVPLALAWLSGADYAFIGTAKSEYYLRDEYGWLPQTPWFYRWLGCYYFPWERFLMSRTQCKAVFPRDSLTAKVLRQWSIPAFDLGNPMMDGLSKVKSQKSKVKRGEESGENKTEGRGDRTLTILLLPGSRSPEAERNWRKIITAVTAVVSVFTKQELMFLGALAPSLDPTPFIEYLIGQGWTQTPLTAIESPINDPQGLLFTQNNTQLILSQNAYTDCLTQAQMAIAMAGTATEQFIGLGKPAIAIVGEGPQFTSTFAEAQTRLLGISITLVQQPEEVVTVIQTLLKEPDRWQAFYENGQQRMGLPGAAKRIAQCILEQFQN